MSGGSYEYLCYKDTSDLVGTDDSLQHLEQMYSDLLKIKDMPGKDEVVKEFEDLESYLLDIKDRVAKADQALERLYPIMHAMEWWQSNDWSEGDVHQEILNHQFSIKVKPDLSL